VDFYENWSENMKNGGRLTTYSVYKFVRNLEDILIGPHESQASESGPYMPKAVSVSHKPKDLPSVDWFAVARAAARETASVSKHVFSHLSSSHGSKWKNEIQKMFDDAHDLIQNRQEVRADEMIKSRNAELERWKKALQETV
jgi:hypothetical protein